MSESTVQKKQYVHISDWLKQHPSIEINQEIKKNYKVINNMANKYSPYNSDLYKNLIAEGMLGLLLAMTKFKSAHNTHLQTYAFYWIKSKMTRFIQKHYSQDMLSLDKQTTNTDGKVQNFADIIADSFSIDNDVNKNNIQEILEIVVNELSTKEYIVIKNRYLIEPKKTFTELAALLDCSKQYVKKLEVNGLDKMKNIIKIQKVNVNIE